MTADGPAVALGGGGRVDLSRDELATTVLGHARGALSRALDSEGR